MLSERYVRYLNNDAAMQSHGVWTRILLIVLALLVIFAQKFEWARETELRRAIVRGTVALGAITILSLFLSTLADRICLYLFFIYVLGIGSMVRYTLRPFKYLSLYLVLCLTYGLFFAWFGLSGFAAAWFPYGIALHSGT
jgi:small-conductance mechanosensitive channel